MSTRHRVRVKKEKRTKLLKDQEINLLPESNTSISVPYESHQIQSVDFHKLYTADYNNYIDAERKAQDYEFQVSLRVAIIPLLYNPIRDLIPYSSIRIPHVYTVNNDSSYTQRYEEQIIKTDHLPIKPVDVTNIKEPHGITKLFPIFKDVSQITKLQQVSNLLKQIESVLQISLQFPFVTGLVIYHNRHSERIESTLYIALTVTKQPKKSVTLIHESDIKHDDFIPLEGALISPQEFIIATLAHSTNKYAIFYNDHILSVQDSLNLPKELKTINDEEKDVTSKASRKY